MRTFVVVAALLAVASTARGECPEVVSKEDWQAAPVTIVENMTVPVPYVVIHHTYIPAACNDSEKCCASMRAMQRYHQGKGWNDIGYNFVIGGDNKAYQGRGWDVVGAHSPKYNFMSIGISFIGDYRTELPSEEMLAVAHSLIECGIERGSISADYKVVGHRQVRSTECPGGALYAHIQTWSHWDPLIDIVPRVTSTAAPTDAPTPLSIVSLLTRTATPEEDSTQLNIVNAEDNTVNTGQQ